RADPRDAPPRGRAPGPRPGPAPAPPSTPPRRRRRRPPGAAPAPAPTPPRTGAPGSSAALPRHPDFTDRLQLALDGALDAVEGGGDLGVAVPLHLPQGHGPQGGV